MPLSLYLAKRTILLAAVVLLIELSADNHLSDQFQLTRIHHTHGYDVLTLGSSIFFRIMAPISSPLQDGDEEYIPIQYSPPRGVENMHNYPRWSFPNKPVYLYGNNATSEEKQDYLRG